MSQVINDPLRGLASALVALVEILLCLSIFGPQPLGWLWVGSQVNFATGSLSSGLAVAFIGSVVSIIATVWAGKRLERVWAALHPQSAEQERIGLFETAFVISTVLAVFGFALWFFVFAGPGPTIAPNVQ
jgi:hypothetical protein